MKLADLFEAEDVDLMMQLAKMLFDKGELHVYWRIDKKHSAGYQGLVVAFNIREYKGADELVVTLRKPDEVRPHTAGYFLADLTTKGKLTKIGKHHALLLTGNFSE
jgi:hypothetical protein